MMRKIKTLLLMFVCFYYAVLTPGVERHRGDEQYLWGAFSVSIFQALIAMALYYFFDWPSQLFGFGASQNSALVGMLFFGGLAGFWTFIGALAYPSLQKILEDRSEALFFKGVGERMDQRESDRLERERDEIEFKALIKESPKQALKELKKANRLLMKGKGHKIKRITLRSSSYVYNEMKRLEQIVY